MAAAKAMALAEDGGLKISGLNYALYIDHGIGPDSIPVTFRFDPDTPETWVNPDCTKAANPDACNNSKRADVSQLTPLNTKGTFQYGAGVVDVDFYTGDVQNGMPLEQSTQYPKFVAAGTE